MNGTEPLPFFERPPETGAPPSRRLLLLTYHFPPAQTAGALRWQKLAPFAAGRGWGLDVVTLDPAGLSSSDPSRLEELPPGTRVFGVRDEPLAIGQLIEDADGAVVVTTPQALATDDVRRSVNFARRLELPVIGLIENMSGLICPECGARIDVFGSQGGNAMGREMGVPMLGSIPFDPPMVRSADAGKLGEYLKSEAPGARAFRAVVRGVIRAVGEASAERPRGSEVRIQEAA